MSRQQPRVLDPLRDAAHQFVVVDSIEEFLQIEIDHPVVAVGDILLRLGHGLMRRPSRSKPVAVGRERPSPIWRWRTCITACWMKRSSTVGMPSLRTPPSGLGISTRRTGFGS